jgi:OFA family oxalate/formate antiporter-like MFS transporter
VDAPTVSQPCVTRPRRCARAAQIYSLFPALCADLYGTKYVGQTYGAVYTGKAVASLLAGPVASAVAATSGWATIIRLMACASLLDAGLAVCLKRLTRR